MAELVLSINNTVSAHALPATAGNNRRVVTDNGSSRWVRISSADSFDIELDDVADDAAAVAVQRYTAGTREVYIGRGEFGISGTVVSQPIDITLIENQSASFLDQYNLAGHRLLSADSLNTRLNASVTIDSLEEDPVTGWITMGYTSAAIRSNPDEGWTAEIGIVDLLGDAVAEGRIIAPTSVVVEIDPSHKGNWAVGALMYGTTNTAGIGPVIQCDGTDFGGGIVRDIGGILTATAFYSDARSVIGAFANNNTSDSAVRGLPIHLLSDTRAVLERELNLTVYAPNPFDRWGLFMFPKVAETASVRFRATAFHLDYDRVLDLAGAP